jgi:3-oxoacyl-[acyl-carrier protein] reductase
MVRTLARAGADVAVHFRSNERQAAALVADLQKLGRRALAVQADVTDQVSVNQMVAQVQASLGNPDILVINAVEQIQPWAELQDECVDDYLSQFRSCVLQSVFLAKATLPGMIEQRWGRIIGINTECTMQLLPTMSAYAAAKRGMDGLLRVLAREVGPDGITVNQVAPGWTLSDKDRQHKSDDASYVRQVPLRRRGTDQEVANVVAFLASDLASFVHGVYLPVCGGNVMPTV